MSCWRLKENPFSLLLVLLHWISLLNEAVEFETRQSMMKWVEFKLFLLTVNSATTIPNAATYEYIFHIKLRRWFKIIGIIIGELICNFNNQSIEEKCILLQHDCIFTENRLSLSINFIRGGGRRVDFRRRKYNGKFN